MGLQDVILSIVFCVAFYRLAQKKGVSPWPYILNYVGAVMLVCFLLAYTFASLYGREALQTEDGLRKALYFAPISIAFEILLYVYFRKKLQKISVVDKDEDNFTPPPPPKKDLSYFR